MVRGKRKSTELFTKSEAVQESRDRESAESSENSVRIVAPAGEFGVLKCEGLSLFLWKWCKLVTINECLFIWGISEATHGKLKGNEAR